MYNEALLAEMSFERDLSGFDPLNIGHLSMSDRVSPLFTPCTPRMCIKFLDSYDVSIDVRYTVVFGSSNIIGLSLAMMLIHRNPSKKTL